MWVLILSEMLVFSAFFVLFAWGRALEPSLFNASQQLLNPVAGGLDTMLQRICGPGAKHTIACPRKGPYN